MYNDLDRQKACFVRLVQHLRDNKVSKRENVTLLLGAGCSLTSSTNDITTSGIIQELVTRFSDSSEDIPTEWSPLYEKFVNNVWSGQGNRDRVHLLEQFFEGMSPSVGYQQVRFLVEHQYVNNIITTNFDMMLNEALQGLSYNLQVGTIKKTIGEKPSFTLIKAHGDIEHGELRFAPSELYKLPSTVENAIKKISGGIIIIAGYRGQDMGILQALKYTDDYCAFWITYNEPDIYNNYENEAIFTWLKKRNSEKNMLYGEEYGDFDNVFSKITEKLIQDDTNKKKLHKEWEKSYWGEYLTLNRRFYDVFATILGFIEEIINEMTWVPKSFYYSEDYEHLIRSILQIANEKYIPTEMMYTVKNEIESLLVALSIEIWVVAQGYPITTTKIIKNIKQKYERDPDNPRINDDFWLSLEWLAALDLSENHIFSQKFCEIVFSFDDHNNYQIILHQTTVEEYAELILIIQALLIFEKTSCQESQLILPSKKKIFEDHLYKIVSQNKSIDIYLSQMTQDEYLYAKEVLPASFIEQNLFDRYTLNFRTLHVQVDVEKTNFIQKNTQFDELFNLSESLKTNFLGDFEPEKFVFCNAYMDITRFLESPNTGMLVVGKSGIGKSFLLKKIICDIDVQTICLPIAAKSKDDKKDILQTLFFVNDASDNFFDKMVNLSEQLNTRGYNLLYIIDSINEIPIPLQQVISLYEMILNICGLISNMPYRNIKVIISCREDFFYQMQQNMCTIPSPSIFYSTITADGNDSTVYNFPALLPDDVTKFIDLYSDGGRITKNELIENYGDVIYIPINLKLILDSLSRNKHNKIANELLLYNLWYNNFLNDTKLYGFQTTDVSEMTNYIVKYKYFSYNLERQTLTTSILFADLKIQNLEEMLSWLVNADCINQPELFQNHIYFSHDKIELFMLIRYIEEKFNGNPVLAIKYLNKDQYSSAIVRETLLLILGKMYEQSSQKLNSYLVEMLSLDDQLAVPIAVDFLMQNITELYNIIKNIELYVTRKVFEKIINLLYSRMEEKINLIEPFPFQGLEKMDSLIQDSILKGVPFYIATQNYLTALYIWKQYSDEIFEDEYKKAISYCKSINNIDTKLLPAILVDKNNYLYASLLRNQGNLNEAVCLIKCVFQSLQQNGFFDEACKALLEMGAIYRELTLFDQALILYDSFDITVLKNETLKYRILMNTGIIFKNKVQNDQFDNNVTNEYTIPNYLKAKQLFEKVYMYAKEIYDIPLILEILAELIECAVAGYYLDLATLANAIEYANEMDEYLPLYPVPVRRIQYYRMWARVFNLQGNILQAIDYLKKGFDIAIKYNIPFRASDCCNQITGILCDHLYSREVTNELLRTGIECGQYAINYYAKLNREDHLYYQNAKSKLQKLEQKLHDNLH